MQTFECPNCSAAVPFHASTVFTVCPFCKSMVLREGVDVSLLGKTSSLPPDLSPIQIGTSGRFGDTSFTVLGRIRLHWSQGAWNEWFIEFGDNTTGWLGEAQGFFMVSRPLPPQNLLEQTMIQPGRLVTLGGMEMTVIDKKSAECMGCEGELPFVAEPGRRSISIDLSGPGAAFGNIEYVEGEILLFAGRYCHFHELNFTNLRPVPGWFGNPPLSHETGIEALNCPNCSASVEVRAPGQSVAVVCGSCATVLDIASRKVDVIANAIKNLHIAPLIPLGSRGTLFGIEYEAIGFMQRGDGPYSWFEYLLFNPHHGYYWLVNYNGHWNFVERLLDTPEERTSDAIHEGQTYSLFLRGEATVRYVMGEFYWRIDVKEKAMTADFIKPPFVLSMEDSPFLNETTWSRGQYINGAELQHAFGVTTNFPEPVGVYLNQPNPYAEKRLWPIAALLLAALLAVQLIGVATARNEVFAFENFTYQSETNRTTAVVEFEIKQGGQQSLAITTAAPVNSRWIEFNHELQGVQSGMKKRFVEALESYSGLGNESKTTVLPSVAPGKYRLLIEPNMEAPAESINYSVTLKGDVPVWQNFWICLTLLLLYPLFRGGGRQNFERQRWAESDYNRFGQIVEEEDDEE